MSTVNCFSDFDPFDIACALYHFLQHNWSSQFDDMYIDFCKLTEIYKPSLSEEYFDRISEESRCCYELLAEDNYNHALELVFNYKSEE